MQKPVMYQAAVAYHLNCLYGMQYIRKQSSEDELHVISFVLLQTDSW